MEPSQSPDSRYTNSLQHQTLPAANNMEMPGAGTKKKARKARARAAQQQLEQQPELKKRTPSVKRSRLSRAAKSANPQAQNQEHTGPANEDLNASSARRESFVGDALLDALDDIDSGRGGQPSPAVEAQYQASPALPENVSADSSEDHGIATGEEAYQAGKMRSHDYLIQKKRLRSSSKAQKLPETPSVPQPFNTHAFYQPQNHTPQATAPQWGTPINAPTQPLVEPLAQSMPYSRFQNDFQSYWAEFHNQQAAAQGIQQGIQQGNPQGTWASAYNPSYSHAQAGAVYTPPQFRAEALGGGMNTRSQMQIRDFSTLRERAANPYPRVAGTLGEGAWAENTPSGMPAPPELTKLEKGKLKKEKRKAEKAGQQEASSSYTPYMSTRKLALRNAGSPGPSTASSPRVKALPVPKPTKEYITQASQEPNPAPSPQHLLIIIDLNGTLIHRPKRAQPTKFTSRPFVPAFLAHLLANHTVMVWSSARPENVANMCAQLFTPAQRGALTAEWGRDMLGLSPHQYNEKVQVYKRLAKVWDQAALAKWHPRHAAGARFGQQNTLLIDDSEAKAASEPCNLLQITEFVGKAEQQSTDVLRQVVGYLEEARRWDDVSRFVARKPFREDDGWDHVWPAESPTSPPDSPHPGMAGMAGQAVETGRGEGTATATATETTTAPIPTGPYGSEAKKTKRKAAKSQRKKDRKAQAKQQAQEAELAKAASGVNVNVQTEPLDDDETEDAGYGAVAGAGAQQSGISSRDVDGPLARPGEARAFYG